PRETLIDTVWPDVVVTDDVLTRCVSELRKLFDDDARAPHVIETIPRVGYRLLAPVTAPYSGDSSLPAAPVFEVAPSVAFPEVAPRQTRPTWLWLGLLLILLLLGIIWWQAARSESSALPQPLVTKPLTSLPGQETMAAFAPAGDRIAFAWQRTDATQSDIYVSPFPLLQPLQLTSDAGDERSPVWSPDGQTLAFIRRTRDECGLFTMRALGGPAHQLASCTPGSLTELSWSPDGQWVALSDKAAPDAPYTVHLVDVATGEKKALAYSTEGTTGDFDPRFSPDGKALLFQRSLGEGQADLFLLTLQDLSLERITSDKTGIGGYTWMADGESIIFSSNRTGMLSLWRKPMPDGEPVWLATGHGAIRPTLADHHLVFEAWNTDTNIYRLTLDDSSPTSVPISPSTRADAYAQYAPDGHRIVFVSSRSGDRNVWLADGEGGNATQLTFHENTQVFAPAWSPDGHRMAYTVFIDGQADIFVIDQPGTDPRRLTANGANEVFPTWSRDGQWIYFGSNRGGTMDLWKQPAGGGEAVQVTTDGGFIAREATDGKTIYYTKEGATGLWRKPLPDDAETLMIPDFDLFMATNWAVHEDAIYYVNRSDPSRVVLTRYDPATATSSEVFTLGPVAVSTGFSMTPDGQHLLFVQTDQRDVDLMMIDMSEAEE
ncbi:MAG TPA: winged helix-turn-helix domain-containing protein, partial [Rhodothermales bacterium]|nr:winged helix-turn-helix domain-containing protein [Rhodothermales bacterium]